MTVKIRVDEQANVPARVIVQVGDTFLTLTDEQTESLTAIDRLCILTEGPEMRAAMLAPLAPQLTTARLNLTRDTEAERDAAYRGRAELLAVLAADCPDAFLVHGADKDAAGWPVLFMKNWLGEQVTWHVSPADLDLFEDVRQLQAGDPGAPVWDGHDNREKSRRLMSGLNIHTDCI